MKNQFILWVILKHGTLKLMSNQFYLLVQVSVQQEDLKIKTVSFLKEKFVEKNIVLDAQQLDMLERNVMHLHLHKDRDTIGGNLLQVIDEYSYFNENDVTTK